MGKHVGVSRIVNARVHNLQEYRFYPIVNALRSQLNGVPLDLAEGGAVDE